MRGNYPDNGHRWQVDEFGAVDNFAMDHEPHNGPKCVTCGYTYCVHHGKGPEACDTPVEWDRVFASK